MGLAMMMMMVVVMVVMVVVVVMVEGRVVFLSFCLSFFLSGMKGGEAGVRERWSVSTIRFGSEQDSGGRRAARCGGAS